MRRWNSGRQSGGHLVVAVHTAIANLEREQIFGDGVEVIHEARDGDAAPQLGAETFGHCLGQRIEAQIEGLGHALSAHEIELLQLGNQGVDRADGEDDAAALSLALTASVDGLDNLL